MRLVRVQRDQSARDFDDHDKTKPTEKSNQPSCTYWDPLLKTDLKDTATYQSTTQAQIIERTNQNMHSFIQWKKGNRVIPQRIITMRGGVGLHVPFTWVIEPCTGSASLWRDGVVFFFL